MMPNFFMIVGLPASGKSHFIRERLKDVVVHSSDAIREELLNDTNSQKDNDLVFKTLHSRVKEDLKNGKDVVYDATNISYKRRMGFLKELGSIKCRKVCHVIMTPYSKCLEQNLLRDRVVPEHVIKKMYLNFDIPANFEGWDKIILVRDEFEGYDIRQLVKRLNAFDQDNPHHTLTLGDHCRKTSKLITEYCIKNGTIDCPHINIQIAGMFHDIGKEFTKGYKDSKGIPKETASYFQHHHVSAYESFFYLHNAPDEDDLLDILQLIRWHMMPYNLKQDSTKRKYIKLFGEDFFNRLMILNKADRMAH